MPAKMSGAELVGRVAAVEGFLMALIEVWIDRPDVDEAKGVALLKSMAASAKTLAAQLGHGEAQSEAERYVDEIIERVTANRPAMRGEFGEPR